MDRVFGDSLSYGPFKQDFINNSMMPENIQQNEHCAVNIASVDQLSPILAEGFVWSWDKGQPDTPNGCTVLKPNGRWATVDCSTRFAYACQNPTDGRFVLSTNATSWGTGQCPSGYVFGRPANGFQNSQLRAMLSTNVWINHKAAASF